MRAVCSVTAEGDKRLTKKKKKDKKKQIKLKGNRNSRQIAGLFTHFAKELKFRNLSSEF